MTKEIKHKFTSDDAQLDKSFNKINTNFNRTQQRSNTFAAGLGNAMRSINGAMLIAGVGVTGLVSSFTNAIKKQVDYAESLDKISQAVGVSAENLSTLDYAAQLSGSSFESLNTSLVRLSRNTLDASRGLTTAQDAFRRVGVSIRNSDGSLKDSYTLLGEVADRFAQVKDGTEKTAIATMLFGRSGAELIPMLNKGSAGLAEMQEKARKLGVEISTNTAGQAAKLKDNILDMESAVTGIVNELSVKLLPTLEETTKKIVDFTQTSNSINTVVAAIDYGIKGIATIGVTLYDTVVMPLKTAYGMLEAVGTLFSEGPTAAGAELAMNLHNVGLELVKNNKYLWEMWGLMSGEKEAAKSKEKANNLAESFTAPFQQIDTQIRGAASFQVEAINTVTEAKKLQLIDEWQINVWRAQSEQWLTDEIIRMNELKQQSTIDSLNNMSYAFDTFYQLTGEKNKALFVLSKAFAVGEAVMNTYLAANKALATVPYPFNFIAAASVIAAGLANVARITSAQPGGSASGGFAGSPVRAPIVNNNNTNSSSQNITVIIQSNYQSKDELARDLVPQIRRAIADGV